MKKKLTISGLFVLLLGATGIAYAACGDSVCGRDASGEWICVAEDSLGDLQVCTVDEPCTIKCK